MNEFATQWSNLTRFLVRPGVVARLKKFRYSTTAVPLVDSALEHLKYVKMVPSVLFPGLVGVVVVAASPERMSVTQRPECDQNDYG